MRAHDRVWTWYLLTVVLCVTLFGRGIEAPGYRPVAYVALHGALLLVLLGLARWAPPTAPNHPSARPWRARGVRGAFTLVALPTVFSSLGMILPWIHPEPWEWTWLRVDRALFGVDPTVALQRLLTPWFTELLQLAYSTFYFLPIVVLLAIARRGDGYAFERGLTTIAFGFLLSYLGYLLFPTLPPYRFLDHGAPLAHLWLGPMLHRLVDLAEVNRFDCFPSGHTMMSLVTLVIAWRDARRWFWILLPIVVLLVFSTMALRYHYAIDVIAGAALVPVVVGTTNCLVADELARARVPQVDVVRSSRC